MRGEIGYSILSYAVLQAYASAMAVLDDGRIACVGVEKEVKKVAQAATKFTSLLGRFVFPVSIHLFVSCGRVRPL